ncbi:3-ketosteroid-9-alpha-monooxygenase, ferredoxin reductase component [BD1-7 clade bacterium]|uniref:3-ketosteroid-9-alpha-monooxygenase, ferredoxin reductase component n=1 Tax=BD1-7 clade bacterium TaxID=2029982 RepID=A0A5S9P7N3_9GAMM|nr:3-ketosteroid-9-alpha-monooxygenase, ferredoxin reductase component [BD1-7 clade bacterium]CAA0099668.1 3-ketosteroid-9-alpha-monooxygenase, ferredoxin reductase component [BD1-7 clade bacterium]
MRTIAVLIFSLVINAVMAQPFPFRSDDNKAREIPPISADMRARMGPYTPRAFYPSLINLPTLSEKDERTAIDLASQRMQQGLDLVNSQLDILHTDVDDYQGRLYVLENAANDVRAGVARYQSGLATLQAIEANKTPQDIALSWFKNEMSLDRPVVTSSAFFIGGMTPFHFVLCLIMSALIALAIAFYYLRRKHATKLIEALDQQTLDLDQHVQLEGTWAGSLELIGIYDETPVVKTFRFIDPASSYIRFAYLPGQFLHLTAVIDGKQVQRAYTLASAPTRHGYIELTIKREENGLFSRFMHEQVRCGDQFQSSAPFGRKTFTGTQNDGIVLIGGGVGITPLMSIIRMLTDIAWNKDIYLIYSCKNSEDFIFRQELEYLRERNPYLHLTVSFTRQSTALEGYLSGRINSEILKKAVPDIKHQFIHMCGSIGFIETFRQLLKELEVKDGHIQYEAFGGEAPVERRVIDIHRLDAKALPTVTFAKSGKTAPLPKDSTVLEVAEAVGVNLLNACRSGYCGTCAVRLIEGDVTMENHEALSKADRDAGIILGCQAKATGNIIVDA